MRSARAAVALSAALAGLSAAAAVPVPALTGPVVDLAGAVDPDSAARLEAIARSAWNGGRGPQLQVLVVRSLEGEPIEDLAMRVAEAWKVGTRGRDDGVLVVVAVDDRKVRIEVGGGVEGSLTDARSARIVRNTLAPAFRARRYGPGLVAAAEEILAALGPSASSASSSAAAPGAPRAAPPEPAELPWILGVLPWALFGAPLAFFALIAALAFVLGRRGLGGRGSSEAGWSYGSSGSSSDFSSSSSDVGGGWSGGGGGFSGGGASGSW